jgi:hypothetical protein
MKSSERPVGVNHKTADAAVAGTTVLLTSACQAQIHAKCGSRLGYEQCDKCVLINAESLEADQCPK